MGIHAVELHFNKYFKFLSELEFVEVDVNVFAIACEDRMRCAGYLSASEVGILRGKPNFVIGDGDAGKTAYDTGETVLKVIPFADWKIVNQLGGIYAAS
jgi:hypothetical protein